MSFKGLHGTRRVLAEYTTLHKQIEDGQSPHLSDLTLVGDNIHTWRLKVKNFDEDTPGGAALNADLQKLNEKYRQDHLLLEATFPEDYPTEPFFLRVIAPRCVWYTGHVTAGGSICIESLTQSGTPGSWDPNFSFEAIMNVVTTNMIDCETVEVRTRTGPGGLSGPLRIDLSHRYCGNVMSPYSMMEAKSAFQRTLRHHSQVGWGGENASNPDPPRGAKRPSRSRTAEKGKASKKSSEKDEGKKPLLPPTTPAQPSLMNPLPSLTPPGSSGALGLAVNSGHQSGVDLTTSVGSWLKSLTHRSGSGSASGSGPGSGPGSGSGSRSKQVPAWVSAKPKPLKKLSQSPVAPQVTSAADDGIFDEVILMLEKEGEKEKQEKMRKAAKKEAKRRRAERGTGDLASSSALGKKAEGSSVVETVDLLGSPLPERTEQKLPLTPGAEGVDLMAAFEKEKRKMEEQWEEERRLREAELAEMERQVRLAKEKSKLVCSPPPNWFSQVEGRNLMVVELPFQPVQHASECWVPGEGNKSFPSAKHKIVDEIQSVETRHSGGSWKIPLERKAPLAWG